MNQLQIFNNEIPALVERGEKRELSTVQQIYPLLSGPEGIYLRRCLNDLNMAMNHADDTPFYCYRALESLRQFFGLLSGKSGDREQWEEMASALSGKKEDTELIRKLAFPARHGVPDPISDPLRKEVFLITWDVVEKFIDYRLSQSGSTFRLRQHPF